jgi:hypothetical protein
VKPFVVILVALLTWAGPALGARPTSGELPATLGTSHFLLHYTAATASDVYAQQGAADFEESYGRLVAGAGGTPNAGLRAPEADGVLGGDSRVDVYLVSPSGGGGQAIRDVSGAGHSSVYLFMDPGLSRSGFRFRAAHELMHAIQSAYSRGLGFATEGTANWAAEWALPDVEPGDNNFDVPHLPLDCSYGTWEGTDCAMGYRQWLFVQRQVEAYGPDFVDGLLARLEVLCGTCTTTIGVRDRQALRETIAAESAGASNLRLRYADYARAIWDPPSWATTAPATITTSYGAPAARDVFVSASAPDSGLQLTDNVDHLASRYLRVRYGGSAPTGPGDRVRITVADPPGLATSTNLLVASATSPTRVAVPLTESCGAGPCATVSADRATVGDIVVPLVNDLDPVGADTAPDDDRAFAWRVEALPGTPTPPSNDERAGAIPVSLAQPSEADTAYAGGLGENEAPGCKGAVGATRGVWFRFTLPNSGVYTFDASATDFRAVVSLVRADTGGFGGCAWSTPSFATQAPEGRVYDVYVGRAATATGFGRTARLKVTGPAGAAPPAPTDTAPPLLTIVRAGLTLSRKGEVAVRISCPVGEVEGCRGTVSLATARKVAARLVGGRARIVTLGSRSFRIAAGRTQVVRVRVKPATRRLLKRLRTVTIRVSVKATDAAGNTFRNSVSLKLRSPA